MTQTIFSAQNEGWGVGTHSPLLRMGALYGVFAPNILPETDKASTIEVPPTTAVPPTVDNSFKENNPPAKAKPATTDISPTTIIIYGTNDTLPTTEIPPTTVVTPKTMISSTTVVDSFKKTIFPPHPLPYQHPLSHPHPKFRALPRVNPELFSNVTIPPEPEDPMTEPEPESGFERDRRPELSLLKVQICVFLILVILIIGLGFYVCRIGDGKGACPSGYQLKQGSGSFLTKSICVPCPVGTHRSHSGAECRPCPPGFFTDGEGAAFCQNRSNDRNGSEENGMLHA